MLPSELKPEQFNGYPPLARKLATDNIKTLRKLPLSFLPSLLREVIDYDYKFPAERHAIDREIGQATAADRRTGIGIVRPAVGAAERRNDRCSPCRLETVGQ